MNTKQIFISKSDYLRIKALITDPDFAYIHNGRTASLKGELERAAVVEDSELSANRVGLNSRVVIKDLRTHEKEEYQLTMPEDMEDDESNISILSPIGTILLGYAAGDEITCDTPGGSRQILIESVKRGTQVPRSQRSVIDEILNRSL
ncbi:MAG: GreA/GreB family elongation factor [Verrucomicrobiota bacterium JB024]|nr:GreA/GreB family elongation factor [Verrucomicrobiota bacterium JB024]